MKNLLDILRYVAPYWGYAALNVLFNILSVIFSLFSLTMIIPFLTILFDNTKIVHSAPPLAFNKDSIIENFNFFISRIIVDKGEINALLYISILVIILFFFKNIFRYLAMYFLAPIRNGVVKDLRNDIYYKILILPLAYFTQQKKGDIISRMTADVQEIEWSIMSSLEMIFREPITLIAFIVTLFLISPVLTVFVIVLLPVTGLLIGRIGKSLRRTSLKGQKKMGGILSIIEETISGLRIIKAFNAINTTNRKFRETNQDYTKVMIRLYRKRDLASPLSEFLGVLVMVVIMWFGGKLVLGSDNSLGAEVFIFYITVFSQLIQPAKAVTTAYYNIQKGVASVERVKYVLNADEVIEEKPDAITKDDFSSEIEYTDVSFLYESEEVLKNVDLTIKKGKTIAIVGPSGAGKTTLVDLLPRFYDCVSGEIRIDGTPIKELRINDLRGLMGIVTQESILFNDSLFNNIAFGMKNVNEEDVIAAAKVANAHEFISKMEFGYNTNIGDRGAKLSGGQRQRISIARAVLKNPPILVLDEATSALDTESERLVQDALMKLMKNRTSLVIAHRLSTIQYADEIIVLDKGRIVERGSHIDLLALKGVYKRLYDLQSFV
ncbi:MAG: ABC transporter ATP-binding protein/permease [Bacteroidales bacterium]|nr:ABC transporter ATP-binding protein/permease [Bacteroidales bacterium]